MGNITKVLWVHSTFEDYIHNSHLWNLARHINTEKYEILACCMRKGGPYEERFRDLGMTVQNMDMKNLLDVRGILRLMKFIRENEVDIVHTSIRLADWYGRIAAKLAGVPFIFSTIRNNDYWRKEQRYFIYSLFDKATIRFNTQLIAVSQGVKDFLIRWQKIDPDKITVIYNGRDVEKYADSTGTETLRTLFHLRDNIPTLGVTARLVRQKSLDTFLQAAQYILQDGRDVQFLIVGDGPLRGELENLTKELRIDRNVVFTGFRTDIPAIFGLLDIFVMSSLWEGLPSSIIEAMSAGKPVVATNVEGVPEDVIDQETGILVPPKNPRRLAKAICTLLDSPEKRQKMGEKGRQRAMKYFSVERMVRDYENFYESYIER